MRLSCSRPLAWLALTATIAAACGSSPETSGTTSSGSTGGGGAAPTLGIELPQAIDGALWANPFTYATVPLHVRLLRELLAREQLAPCAVV